MREGRKTRYPGVYQTDDGYLIRWTVQVQGHRKDRSEWLAGCTLEEAVRVRSERVSSTKTGSERPPDAPTPTPAPPHPPLPPPPKTAAFPTVGAYCRSWLAAKLGAGEGQGMKPGAAETYAQVLAQRFLPVAVDEAGVRAMGDHRLDEVTRAHVERWARAAETATRPASRAPDAPRVLCAHATLEGWWTKVRQVLQDAAAEYQLPDPTLRVRGPKGHGRRIVKEQRTLQPDELAALLEAIGDGWHAEVVVDSMIGARAGELYALTWPDIDFGRVVVVDGVRFEGVITIRSSHHRGRRGPTKTYREREVPMPPELRAVLLAHRDRQLREQHPALSTGLVFPASEEGARRGPDGERHSCGWHRSPDSLRTHLKRASARAGLSFAVTGQVLRRTVNTLLYDAGVRELVIRSILGQVSDRMTAHYYGAPVGERGAAVAKMVRLVAR